MAGFDKDSDAIMATRLDMHVPPVAEAMLWLESATIEVLWLPSDGETNRSLYSCDQDAVATGS
jgi:hypothetical protein